MKFIKSSSASSAVVPDSCNATNKRFKTKNVIAFCLAKLPIGCVKNVFIR